MIEGQIMSTRNAMKFFRRELRRGDYAAFHAPSEMAHLLRQVDRRAKAIRLAHLAHA